jgi:SAM-dependent methyltransferase
MSLRFRFRDRRLPPAVVLQEAGVFGRMTVLDFGCGPGGFSLAAARLVGPEGSVLALDTDPLARRSVERAARRKGLKNIHMVPAGLTAEIPASYVDMVLLYDVLHDLPDPGPIMAELNRVLRRGGVLSVSDHHLEEADLASKVVASGHFTLARRDRWTFRFDSVRAGGGAR